MPRCHKSIWFVPNGLNHPSLHLADICLETETGDGDRGFCSCLPHPTFSHQYSREQTNCKLQQPAGPETVPSPSRSRHYPGLHLPSHQTLEPPDNCSADTRSKHVRETNWEPKTVLNREAEPSKLSTSILSCVLLNLLCHVQELGSAACHHAGWVQEGRWTQQAKMDLIGAEVWNLCQQ